MLQSTLIGSLPKSPVPVTASKSVFWLARLADAVSAHQDIADAGDVRRKSGTERGKSGLTVEEQAARARRNRAQSHLRQALELQDALKAPCRGLEAINISGAASAERSSKRKIASTARGSQKYTTVAECRPLLSEWAYAENPLSKH